MKEKLDWERWPGFVVGKGEWRVGIDLGYQVLRETLGVRARDSRARRETNEKGIWNCDSPTKAQCVSQTICSYPFYR